MAHAASHDDAEITGINVTPLVDIMLVLLLIFMITTHLDQPGALGVELPRASTASEPPVSSLSIVIAKDGGLRLDGRATTLAAIEAQARRGNDDTQAVVSADKGVPYERVVGVVDAVRRGGVHKLALAADLEETR
ncbi:MAG TPA: biopolymer transporter ExbD [Kofleriaceae bacterium]|nr:biopolymer transporter ExbD [Kofleriaceae bacterium]